MREKGQDKAQPAKLALLNRSTSREVNMLIETLADVALAIVWRRLQIVHADGNDPVPDQARQDVATISGMLAGNRKS